MRRRPPSSSSRRRGMSLAVVMAVLSTAVVLSIALLHSQTATLRIVENGRAAERAAEATQAGLAAALDAMQTPTWTGVGTVLTAEVGRDTLGYSWYKATFEKVPGDGTEAGATAAALQVRVRSKGHWQAFGSARSTQREAYADVALTPRLPGRLSRPGDVAIVNDRAADVVGFADASSYALCAVTGSDSFAAAPQTRVAGNVWIAERIEVFGDLACTSTQLADLLTGLGTDHGGTNPHPSPHPLAGGLIHYRALDSTAVDALTRLKVTRTVAGRGLTLPAFDPARYRKYRLFAGGFEYDATPIGSTLQNVSLGPTDANPLGVFYCNGSLSVRDNVAVRGTLVATSGITFDGRGVAVTPVDWRDASGGDLVTDRYLWPILPAVVAGGNVVFSSAARVLAEGTVIADGDVVTNTPDYAAEGVLLNYDGTATAKPLGGGMSEVRIADLLSLLGLTISDTHAVQFRESSGQWGRWHPVVTANSLAGLFRVRGTVEFPSPVSCRFRPRRIHYADIAGPLIANRVRFGVPPAWASLSGSAWTQRHNTWIDRRDGILNLLGIRIGGDPNLTFSRSLAQDGLPFEPTVSVTRPANVNYACEPPLFRPDPSARSSGGGYRWKILAWREVREASP